ncbi:uncharacterized protein LOC134445787 [Engraulis encrasicolus]|uniref:uncharacterized protein LOC134445787 n=1 Tax=Engraulis encrasicolus TaxID=184585 RepID=UPI002FD52974
MSVPMDVESFSGSSSSASDTSLICGSSPSPPVTLSGEPHSAVASSPSPVCAGPSQSVSECLSLESLSRETDISATSTPSPSSRPRPLRGVVKCWTAAPGGHNDDSRAADSSSSDSLVMELAAVCGPSSSYFMLDSDSNDGRSVIPMVDACLGDATSLLDLEDDEGDAFWNTITDVRVDNAGDCHLSDASSYTEVRWHLSDASSSAEVRWHLNGASGFNEVRWHLNDASGFNEIRWHVSDPSRYTEGHCHLGRKEISVAFSNTQLRGWPTITATGNIDNASLCPVQELRVVVPTCWAEEEEEEEQGTAEQGETPERNGRVPAEQDYVQSFHLEPEPHHLNVVETADAAFSSLKRQTPTKQLLLQDQADGDGSGGEDDDDTAAGRHGSVDRVEQLKPLQRLERLGRGVEEMQLDIIRHLQMVKTHELQEGAHKRQKNGVCSFLRRLCNKCRCLGKRNRKVGPQITKETNGTQGMKERNMAETCKETHDRQVTKEITEEEERNMAETREEDMEEQADVQQHQKGICSFLRRLGNAARDLRKKKRSTEESPSERKGLRRFSFKVSCFK